MTNIGRVADAAAPINFIIEPYIDGGFVLNIGFAKDGTDETARIGRWPAQEKAQEMAERIASRLLNGAPVVWHAS